MTIKRILIANRGEIAVRIIRACRELGIETVAVYSDADKNSLHVQLADDAIHIGSPPSIKSYLNQDVIISAAKEKQVDAIHPGYGFLAENAYFCEICIQNNINFIGPSAEAIKNMGNKIEAINYAIAAGVPVVTDMSNKSSDFDHIKSTANTIGYPVLLKAASGGGGKGMKIVYDRENLEKEFVRTKREVEAVFGDGDLYVEKYIKNARHVEVQVLFDQYGNGIHLGERDCSIQRRHQKLLEEAPSPVISQEMRDEMTEAALKLASYVKYFSAGTVEFVVDIDKEEFYFIEMNTRIQVEHPVTESLTDVDLIKEQILIAAGEKLTIQQADIELRGHAIECRINAEDPDRQFTPNPGKLESFIPPGGPGVRVDTSCFTGYEVPPFYDSMIAKIVTKGKDREEAISRMHRALSEFKIEGIPTTIPFHKELIKNEDFISSNYNTRWVEESFYNK
ncbi:acetyl-CoA carboxylase biotin carboxylase subunit [Virgibacillus natechei]|uniref:acetyl-CoA carboxylase biotin carboxylase subunit n=1 Tax=Virgibacillus sp. CBA3643 TaxID=2942278 RepID=UPI0035A31D97